MKMRFIPLAVFALALMTAPAFALDLHEARSTGLVGEKLDGYVAPLKETSEVKALADDVNAKRKQEYARISKENGQPVDVVARLAAQQILGKLTPGSPYQAPDGSWKKR